MIAPHRFARVTPRRTVRRPPRSGSVAGVGILAAALVLVTGCAATPEPQPDLPPVDPPAPTYRVRWDGQTPESIAAYYTGYGDRCDELLDPVNPGIDSCRTELRAGVEVEIPPGLPDETLPESDRETLVHVILWRGQTLAWIADWYTGDRGNWERLTAPVNPELSSCCVALRLGRRVRIPRELVVHESSPVPVRRAPSTPPPTPAPTPRPAPTALPTVIPPGGDDTEPTPSVLGPK